MIRVLIIEDSPTMRILLKAILESDAVPEDQTRLIQALFKDERAIMGVLRRGKR